MVNFPNFENDLKCDQDVIKNGKLDAKRCMIENERQSDSGKQWDIYVQSKDGSSSNNVRVRVKDGKVGFITCNCEEFRSDSYCEHAIASLFTIRDQGNPGDGEDKNEEEKKEVLDKRKNSNDNDDDYDDYDGQKRQNAGQEHYIGFQRRGWVEHFKKLNLLVDVYNDEITLYNKRERREGDKLLVYEVINSDPKEVRFKYEVPIRPHETMLDERRIVDVKRHKDLLLVIFYELCDTTTYNDFHLFKLSRGGVKESEPLHNKYYTYYSKVEYGTHLAGGEDYKIVFSDNADDQYFEIIRKDLPAKIHFTFES